MNQSFEQEQSLGISRNIIGVHMNLKCSFFLSGS